MPTENRSSNTEMVSVPREWLNSVALLQMPLDELQDQAIQHLCEPCDEPAPQPNPEPMAWMVGTAIWWTKAEAERDSAEVGLPVIALGPIADPGEVERLREQLAEAQECYRSIAMRSDLAAGALNEQEAELKQVRSLLRESYAEFLAIKAEIGFRGATIALIGRIEAALSASAEPRPQNSKTTEGNDNG
ncbi:hypothetical protein [Pseudomonas sp.]|uniref:hypothetical protein n=1 Tax=Pseudomonas sp. TaxID=306 RepID=UPI0031D24BFB